MSKKGSFAVVKRKMHPKIVWLRKCEWPQICSFKPNVITKWNYIKHRSTNYSSDAQNNKCKLNIVLETVADKFGVIWKRNAKFKCEVWTELSLPVKRKTLELIDFYWSSSFLFCKSTAFNKDSKHGFTIPFVEKVSAGWVAECCLGCQTI